MNHKKLKLQDKFIEYLESQPEQGMGYQIVDLHLKNGMILQNRIVLNSAYLQLENDENITANDIESLTIANRK